MDTHIDLGMAPEEYVRGIVAERDGWAWQTSLVQATGWSKTTVSRLLSDMEQTGHVVRRSIGRRKVVVLPDVADDTIGDRPTPG